MKKENKVYLAVKSHPILSIILACQVLAIIYINLLCLSNYMGYDASTYYLQAMEMWKQKAIFIENWSYQTTLNWDSPVPLAAFFYGLLNNIFVAFGISNLIIISLLVAVLWQLLKGLSCSIRSKLFFFIFFLSPYLSIIDAQNNIEYFFMMFISVTPYSVKILIILLICLSFLTLEQEGLNNKSIWLSIITILLCGLSGVSSGYYVLMFGIAPLFLFYIIRGIIQNCWIAKKKSSLVFILMGAAINLGGKFFTEHILGFVSKDTTTIWTSIDKFWDNLLSIFSGYLKITGAIPITGEVQILTSMGLGFIFSMAISFLVIYAGIAMVVNSLRGKIGLGNNILAWELIGNLLILIFAYTTYGAYIFESRYLIPILIILFIYAAQWLDWAMSTDNDSFSIVMKVCVPFCLVVCNIISYRNVFYSQSDLTIAQEVINQVSELSSPIVYVGGDELGVMARNIRVLDDSKTYKYSSDMKSPHHWGDYTYYDETSEYSNSTILVCADSYFASLPIYLTSKYTQTHTVPGTNIGIYEARENPIDFATGLYLPNRNVDYPYSAGVITYEHGTFEPTGAFIAKGAEGYALFGPYSDVKEGTFDFTLHYEVLSNPGNVDDVGTFDIAINQQQFQQTDIVSGRNSVTIPKVIFDQTQIGKALEYRVRVNKGVILKIILYEITASVK